MQRRSFLLKTSAALAAAGVALAGCTTTTDQPASASTNESRRRSINAAVDGTMSRLFETVPGSRELVGKSRGVLVFPQVIQAGFVVGGQHGDGALRVGGRTEGYFSTTSASVGAQIGVQSKSIIYLFMTQDALERFRKSDGWSAGGDASVALVKAGANGAIDTTTATSPVEVFVLTNTGLMGDLSLSGTKITRLPI
ncbi:BPSL1445 family SYLF domain-containing lipoprotein [Paraburkholderia caballeronis]|uniref:Lipid-binding SYLF domain-containing protein n=1 Tax=Paraburkholderia caballeronis TaxID=416943 RepID=A0A1H7JEK2_9BURK|nr:YSC84-related protein [Paraburkholderia caballeronis]PXW27462.1 lipid-binding SYLF domain-containing protein [Paraburkholderia caballeronis]PXX02936.1 lipid-binding SYLF domain-containing protein [Paraburkholderia caballeronis]RAK03661.1 lipid-binding SYLF domain-containing protein [Paraburkholderia caballeronis]TDV06089.1 lipid-binding SYLF domain-containing protein [Paraburkholderia caballeronis]TDV09629.1 lipid-binding SYLF domain-containing protein [Paraburkholderia caballeronis]